MLRSNDSRSEVSPDDDDGKPFRKPNRLSSWKTIRGREKGIKQKYDFHLWLGRRTRRETKLQSIAKQGEGFFLPIDLRCLEDLITIFLSAFSPQENVVIRVHLVNYQITHY